MTDHLTLLIRLRLWQPSNIVIQLLERISLSLWLIECIVIVSLAILSSIDNTMRLQELNRSSAAANDYEVYGLMDHEIENERQHIRQSQERSIIKILRQICDTPVCMHFLGLIGSPKTHGYYGLLGAASSLLGIYQHWPVVYIDETNTTNNENKK
jgi:hypothetical protein